MLTPGFYGTFLRYVNSQIFLELTSKISLKMKREQYLQTSLSVCLVQLLDAHDMQENVRQINLQLLFFADNLKKKRASFTQEHVLLSLK